MMNKSTIAAYQRLLHSFSYNAIASFRTWWSIAKDLHRLRHLYLQFFRWLNQMDYLSWSISSNISVTFAAWLFDARRLTNGYKCSRNICLPTKQRFRFNLTYHDRYNFLIYYWSKFYIPYVEFPVVKKPKLKQVTC
jgi:hypothetical protein